jgi:HPt (histidine-containing phosphotransfer) domain-containing protein
VAGSPAEGLPPAAQATFESLRANFRAGLPGRRREIALAANAADRAAALHRLAGAAGSYGFDELGRAAREAEHLARAGDDGPALQSALRAVQAALDAASA